MSGPRSIGNISRQGQARRHECSHEVFLKLPHRGPVLSRLHNVSRSGMFVRLADPPSPGTLFAFELVGDGGHTIRGLARVRWVRRQTEGEFPAGLGAEFEKLDPTSREGLDSLVSQLSSNRQDTSPMSQLRNIVEQALTADASDTIDLAAIRSVAGSDSADSQDPPLAETPAEPSAEETPEPSAAEAAEAAEAMEIADHPQVAPEDRFILDTQPVQLSVPSGPPEAAADPAQDLPFPEPPGDNPHRTRVVPESVIRRALAGDIDGLDSESFEEDMVDTGELGALEAPLGESDEPPFEIAAVGETPDPPDKGSGAPASADMATDQAASLDIAAAGQDDADEEPGEGTFFELPPDIDGDAEALEAPLGGSDEPPLEFAAEASPSDDMVDDTAAVVAADAADATTTEPAREEAAPSSNTDTEDGDGGAPQDVISYELPLQEPRDEIPDEARVYHFPQPAAPDEAETPAPAVDSEATEQGETAASAPDETESEVAVYELSPGDAERWLDETQDSAAIQEPAAAASLPLGNTPVYREPEPPPLVSTRETIVMARRSHQIWPAVLAAALLLATTAFVVAQRIQNGLPATKIASNQQPSGGTMAGTVPDRPSEPAPGLPAPGGASPESADIVPIAPPAATPALEPTPTPAAGSPPATGPEPGIDTTDTAGEPAEPPAAVPDTALAREAVLAWARAWAAQDPDAYLAFYARDFRQPPGVSRTQWEAGRRQRLTAPEFIEVTVQDLRIEATGDERARAVFSQTYRSNTWQDSVRKTLELIWEDESWQILSEVTE